MKESVISKQMTKKDFDVLINSDFESSALKHKKKKVQKLLGYIQRQTQFRNKEIILTLTRLGKILLRINSAV